MNVVALAGGTGAAKFLRGLVTIMPAKDVTVIGNTGDDFEVWGLSVSPDLDTVMYTLAGLVDETKGWGVRDDTFHCRESMATLGGGTFLSIGDKDLAVHLRRTGELRGGAPLSRVTSGLCSALGVTSRILPMTDDRVRTRVRTPEGWLAFQEFFVRERCHPEVLEVAFDGADRATPAPSVLEAIHGADAIVIGPSNPVSSVGPILAVPGVRAALIETRARVVAVSPIVGASPVSGPAGNMMRARGLEVSALGVSKAYDGLLDALVVDRQDSALADPLRAVGVRMVATDAFMSDRESERALARVALEAIA